MEKYYIEVTDERVDLDPPYIWQSEKYENKKTALKTGRRIAQEFGSSNIKTLLTQGEYLNPNWIKSAKGVKRSLHVNLMVVNSNEIKIEENIK